MPLYTLTCPDCGATEEVICKVSEREAATADCDCGGQRTYNGTPELIQSRDFGKGAYRFQVIDSKGRKSKTLTGSRRGDT